MIACICNMLTKTERELQNIKENYTNSHVALWQLYNNNQQFLHNWILGKHQMKNANKYFRFDSLRYMVKLTEHKRIRIAIALNFCMYLNTYEV